METISRTFEVFFNGQFVEFDVILSVAIANDGIGAYEYWGARGYDHGQYYVEETSLKIMKDTTGNKVDFNSLPWIVKRQIEKQVDRLDSNEIMRELAENEQAAMEDARERDADERSGR